MNKDMEIAVETAAQQHGVPLLLLMAMVMVESSARWDVTRKEPHYRWVVNANTGAPFRKLKSPEDSSESCPGDFEGLDGVTTAQEEWEGQRTSHGPLQVMGAVARELGFRGKFEELGRIEGINYGARHLRNFYDRHFDQYGLDGVIAAYNCGQPKPEQVPQYIEKVTAQMSNLKPIYGG